MRLEVIPLQIQGLIEKGERLDRSIIDALASSEEALRDGDIVVIGQKVISKSEGRVVNLSNVIPSPTAKRIAKTQNKDPRVVELILQESREILALTRDLIISETQHGWVCANAGVDLSNTRKDTAVLLPLNPDRSASLLRQALCSVSGAEIAVIISDTFGRPFRNGQANVAIGASGIMAIKSYIGTEDMYGNKLRVTEIAIADELAGAAELVMGKTDSVPVAIIRGYDFKARPESGAKILIRKRESDIFRRKVRTRSAYMRQAPLGEGLL